MTSATAYAQAIVLAVFFAGLGIGAVFPGRLAARARKPLLGYCLLELGALASSLASIPLFTQLDRFRGALSRAGAAPGTALAGELFLACVFLLVPTVLMGASLPFALEHAERIAGQAVRRRFVPLAYGINTFGAALGCAFAGYFLIERWGLARTTAVGAGLSFAAAAIALSAARQAPSTIPRIETGEDAEDKPSNVPRSLIAAAAAAGFVGVGAEVVWLRLFSLIILNTVYAFTQVLIAVLLGIVLGSVFARSVASRVSGSRALLAAGLAQAGAAIGIASVGPLAMLLSGRTEIETAIATGRSVLGGIGLVIALCIPVALNAATLPLLVQSQRGTGVSRSFGSFYAANTGGSVLGSLLCGFVVIPALGTTGASGCLEAVSLAIAFALVWVGSEAKRDAFATLAPGLVVVVLHLVLPTAGETMCQSRLPAGTRILELREGIASNVMVTESQAGQRRLWINSSCARTPARRSRSRPSSRPPPASRRSR